MPVCLAASGLSRPQSLGGARSAVAIVYAAKHLRNGCGLRCHKKAKPQAQCLGFLSAETAGHLGDGDNRPARSGKKFKTGK